MTSSELADARAPERQNLVGLDRAELAAALEIAGVTGFRVKQVWQWIYHRGVTDFDQMTNISKQVRQQMADRFVLVRPAVSSHQQSSDGS